MWSLKTSQLTIYSDQALQCIPTTQLLVKLRQEYHKFEASLSNLMRPRLRIKMHKIWGIALIYRTLEINPYYTSQKNQQRHFCHKSPAAFSYSWYSDTVSDTCLLQVNQSYLLSLQYLKFFLVTPENQDVFHMSLFTIIYKKPLPLALQELLSSENQSALPLFETEQELLNAKYPGGRY